MFYSTFSSEKQRRVREVAESYGLNVRNAGGGDLSLAGRGEDLARVKATLAQEGIYDSSTQLRMDADEVPFMIV